MFKTILRAIGLMKPAEKKEIITTKESAAIPATNTKADPMPRLKLADQPGLDLLALQARYAKNKANGKRRHHKPRPQHY